MKKVETRRKKNGLYSNSFEKNETNFECDDNSNSDVSISKSITYNEVINGVQGKILKRRRTSKQYYFRDIFHKIGDQFKVIEKKTKLSFTKRSSKNNTYQILFSRTLKIGLFT